MTKSNSKSCLEMILNSNGQDVVDGVANALAVMMQTDKVMLQASDEPGTDPEPPHIAHICVEKPEPIAASKPVIAIRTSNGELWYLMPIRHGERTILNIPEFAILETFRSFQRFEVLENENAKLLNIVADIEGPTDLAHQSWYESLTEGDREIWDRWGSGGYATRSEFYMIKQHIVR